MVLINGVKYACERCIRGHRVTTCTHTDQPLMMIKPKGRPSTACDHCKNARKYKNQHQKCTCAHRTPGQPHESSCPCKDDETCSCQKTSNKKKTTTVHTPLKKQNSRKRKPVAPSQAADQNGQQPPPPSASAELSDYSLFQRSNIHNPDTNDPALHSFDMSLSTGSISSEFSNLANNNSNSVSSNLNLLPRGRIGMEYLNDFKPTTSPTNSSRIGEVTVPIDEYVQPLHQMTTNLNKLLSNNNSEVDPKEEAQDEFFGDIPVPFSGNGLLDLFQDNSLMSNNNESTTSLNTTNSSVRFRSKSPTLSELSPSNSSIRFPFSTPGTDSMFPLFHVASSNNSSVTTTPLSPGNNTNNTNSNNNNNTTNGDANNTTTPAQPTPPLSQQQQPQSSSSQHHLHHHYQQLPPHHSNHSHGHYNSHFSPYPTAKRSESFISATSSTTSDIYQNHRPPVNQSTDSLISLQHQQTLTDNNPIKNSNLSLNNDGISSPNIVENLESFDLFDGNTIDTYLNKTNFNI